MTQEETKNLRDRYIEIDRKFRECLRDLGGGKLLNAEKRSKFWMLQNELAETRLEWHRLFRGND